MNQENKHREMLELAAKAYGIQVEYRHCNDAYYYYDDPETGREEWNPRDDDGQALRLAVALGIGIQPLPAKHRVIAYLPGGEEIHERAFMGLDLDIATRLAVFRAAVEIGRAMP